MPSSRNLVLPPTRPPTRPTTGDSPPLKALRINLPPGRSQLDWARLEKSGQNLRGIEDCGIIRITKNELFKHNTHDDCWIALRGRVYNITAYLEFHPGGVDVLMEYAGKEATAAFLQIHPWVNSEHMLQACFIGFLIR